MKTLINEADSGRAAGESAAGSTATTRLPERVRSRGRPSQLEMERFVQHRRERHLALPEADSEDFPQRTEAIGSLLQLQAPPPPLHEAYAGDPELVVAADPFGEEAEVFRELRTQLLAKALTKRSRTALAVVSAGRGEGKSYVAANLAASLAQLGGRTLLIDADLRTPRLHRLLGIGGPEGLSSILCTNAAAPLVHPVPQVPCLFFVAAGSVPPNPVELLQGPRFSVLLYEMLSSFEHVVLDTPADAWGADARLVASKAGAALVLGRQDRTATKDMQALLTRLGSGSAEIAGVVLNHH
jgi:receptor protein-tyrosine kinase